MKTIREISDCTAYVVIDRKGNHAATVNFRYGSGGGVQCDVWTPDGGLTHQKKACGYGYDKKTAALAGATVAGYVMADHCGHVEPKGEAMRKRIMNAYRRALGNEAERDRVIAQARRHGFHFANGYTSLYPASGLDRLRMLGFTVIEAL